MLTCVEASLLAVGHAPEVVGVAEAAAVVEMSALLRLAVEEEALHQTSAGARGLRQVTRVLIV